MSHPHIDMNTCHHGISLMRTCMACAKIYAGNKGEVISAVEQWTKEKKEEWDNEHPTNNSPPESEQQGEM